MNTPFLKFIFSINSKENIFLFIQYFAIRLEQFRQTI